jgi:hypothetical protein
VPHARRRRPHPATTADVDVPGLAKLGAESSALQPAARILMQRYHFAYTTVVPTGYRGQDNTGFCRPGRSSHVRCRAVTWTVASSCGQEGKHAVSAAESKRSRAEMAACTAARHIKLLRLLSLLRLLPFAPVSHSRSRHSRHQTSTTRSAEIPNPLLQV